MSNRTFVKKCDGISFYRYKPSLIRLYDKCYNSSNRPDYFNRIVHHIRMSIELITVGYEVFYMYDDNMQILGHLVVSRGGGRVEVSTIDDIVIGPIWVCPSQRGKGIGTKGIDVVLNSLGIKYRNAYEFIAKDNIASIRSVEKNNYQLIGNAKEYGLFKKLKINPNGEWLLYKYVKKN